MKIMSYTLAAMAGLCFVSGLIIWSNEGDIYNGTIGDTSSIVG